MRKTSIAVIGDARVNVNSIQYKLALELGKTLTDNNYRIINGGMSGIMEAVCKGAKMSTKYSEGMVISILPGFDPDFCNKFVDVAIPTGLDTYRNGIVANSDAVIAIGGGAGTLSEIAYAWIFKRMILAYEVDGWSGKLSNTKIDERKRIEWEGDKVFGISNANDAIKLLSKYLKFYKDNHESIISYYQDKEL